MTLQEVKKDLEMYFTEIKCQVYAGGWGSSIPIVDVKKWIKKVETKLINRIKDEHECNESGR